MKYVLDLFLQRRIYYLYFINNISFSTHIFVASQLILVNIIASFARKMARSVKIVQQTAVFTILNLQTDICVSSICMYLHFEMN